MTIERFKLSFAKDTEGYITDKIEHKTYFLRGDNAKKEITGILNQFYNENEDLKTDISVLNRHYDEYANICAKLKKENVQLKQELNDCQTKKQNIKDLLMNSEAVVEQKKLQELIYNTVFNIIDDKIKELEDKYEFGQTVYNGCPMHNIQFGINTLKELKNELSVE